MATTRRPHNADVVKPKLYSYALLDTGMKSNGSPQGEGAATDRLLWSRERLLLSTPTLVLHLRYGRLRMSSLSRLFLHGGIQYIHVETNHSTTSHR